MQIFLGEREEQRESIRSCFGLVAVCSGMDAQSSTTNLRMESPTEMPSPTASEKNEVWDWEIVQSPDEAWPRPAEARAAQAARAAAAAASVLREEFPDLECTTHDLSADQENTKGCYREQTFRDWHQELLEHTGGTKARKSFREDPVAVHDELASIGKMPLPRSNASKAGSDSAE